MAESTATAALNIPELLDRVDGDVAFVAELAAIFRQEYPRQIDSLRACIEQGEADGLKRNAHALKGALANLSAIHAASLAAALERIGASGTTSVAQVTFEQLEAELPNVLDALDELCKEPVL